MTPPNTKWPSVFYTVWDEAWAALTQPRQYIKWAYQPFRRSVAYLSILLGIIAIAVTIYLALVGWPQVQQAREWLSQNVPQITFKDGQMSIENDETFLFSDNQDIYLKVDAQQALADSDVDAFYGVGIVAAGDGVYIRNNGNERTETYKDLGLTDTTFTGGDLANGLGRAVKILLAISPLLLFVLLLAQALLQTFIVTVVFYFLGSRRAHFMGLWSMALYAMTGALAAGYLLTIFLPIPYITQIIFVVYMTLAVYQLHKFLDFQDQYRQQQS